MGNRREVEGAGWRVHAEALALAALLLVGLLVRIPGLDAEPPNFHRMRQLHSAQVARSMYEAMPGVDDHPERAPRPATIEPPVSEAAAAVVYRVTGGERLWVARLISSVYWLVGGWALFALLSRHASLLGRVGGTALYLFAPLAVQGGRSFQPDSLMLAATLVSMWALTVAVERRSRRWRIWSVVAGAVAVFVKPVIAPFLLAYLAAIAFADGGFAALRRRSTVVTAACLVAPGIAFYGWQALNSSEAQRHSSSSFIPSLFTEREYYEATFRMVTNAVPLPVLVLALLAPLVGRLRRDRIVTGALWLAYLAHNIPSNYRTATHDYYHLPLLVVAAFGLAVTMEAIAHRVGDLPVSRMTRTALAALPLVFVAAVAVRGVADADMTSSQGDAMVQRDRRIGEIVGDGAPVLAVTNDYGSMLAYYGNVSVSAYPTPADDQLSRRAGLPVRTPGELIEESDADWVVVTDVTQVEANPALIDELVAYRLEASGDTWAVWSLRERAED